MTETVEPGAPLVGATLGARYDVLGLLGRGGMGEVYRARDRELDEEVALKVIAPAHARDQATLARFRAEVKLARRVTHRGVARTFELGVSDGVWYCTMELIDGETLGRRLARAGAIPPAEAIAIARALCEALAAAHDAGVIHRDVKPGNVMLARDGRVVLADFGIATLAAATARDVAGTPAYMAPELLRGAAPTAAADVYAVGVVLHEMLRGAPAFPGATVEIRAAKQGTPHLAVAGVDPALAAVVARATAREPEARVPTATALADALARLDPAAADAPAHVAGDGAALPAPGVALRTVVVRPPRTLQGGDDALALGLHEQVLERLSRLPRVRARARASGAAAGATADATVGLAVGAGLEAEVARPGAAPLLLRTPLDVSTLDDAAAAVAAAVELVLAAGEAAAAGPARAEARALVLCARTLLRGDLTEVDAPHALLERAHALAPEDARATAALALSTVARTFRSDDDADARLASARRLVEQALAHRPPVAEAEVAAAQLALNTGDPVAAARHFRQAIARSPHVAEAHDYLGRLLLEAGFVEEGLRRLDDASSLAPGPTVSRWYVARAHALQGDHAAADAVAAELRAAARSLPLVEARMRWWRTGPGDAASARATMPDVSALSPGILRGLFEALATDAWAARRAELVARLRQPSHNRRRRAFEAQCGAEIAALHGDRAAVLAALAVAGEAGLVDLHWLDRCPLLAPWRGDVELRPLRTLVRWRAGAILDALYGDREARPGSVEPVPEPPTALG